MERNQARLPSITELARLIATTEDGLERGADNGREEHADALRRLIATMPPQNLSEAAVLVAEAALLAWESEVIDDLTEIHCAADRIKRMLLRALPIVAVAAGLDYPGQLAWGDLEEHRANLFGNEEGALPRR